MVMSSKSPTSKEAEPVEAKASGDDQVDASTLASEESGVDGRGVRCISSSRSVVADGAICVTDPEPLITHGP